jgi:enoyl-CoA hydratase/carnithine racemase
MPMSPHITTAIENKIGTIILSRPEALNSLSLDMVRHLSEILSTWASASNVHAVMICSSKPGAFCAGGDIRFFHEVGRAKTGDSGLLEDFFTEEYALNYLIHHYSKPYISMLDGIVMGGGMGISQSGPQSRIRVVTERTRMAMPEVNIGLFPDVGGGYFLSRLRGKLGTYLGLTGEIIGATDALFADLADAFIPSLELPRFYAALRTINNEDYHDLVTQFSKPYKNRIDRTPCMLVQHQTLIDQHFANDNVFNIITSLQKDSSPFAQKTVEIMSQRSPLMLCVSLEQIRRARTMTIADCLRMERTMMHHCFEHGDAIEGIRAAIIDKDNLPQWQPASLEEVTEKMVARFFEPVWSDQTHPLRALQ